MTNGAVYTYQLRGIGDQMTNGNLFEHAQVLIHHVGVFVFNVSANSNRN